MDASKDADQVGPLASADEPVDDEVMAEAIIADCDGDPRAAVLALLRINHALMRDRRTIVSKVSKGYIRLRDPGLGEVQ